MDKINAINKINKISANEPTQEALNERQDRKVKNFFQIYDVQGKTDKKGNIVGDDNLDGQELDKMKQDLLLYCKSIYGESTEKYKNLAKRIDATKFDVIDGETEDGEKIGGMGFNAISSKAGDNPEFNISINKKAFKRASLDHFFGMIIHEEEHAQQFLANNGKMSICDEEKGSKFDIASEFSATMEQANFFKTSMTLKNKKEILEKINPQLIKFEEKKILNFLDFDEQFENDYNIPVDTQSTKYRQLFKERLLNMYLRIDSDDFNRCYEANFDNYDLKHFNSLDGGSTRYYQYNGKNLEDKDIEIYKKLELE